MKHIKILAIIFLIHLVYFEGFGQNINPKQEVRKTKKTEIGINVTNLVNTFIDLSERTPVEEPFDFVLKRVKDNAAFRMHFGIIGNKQRDENNTDQTAFLTHCNLKLGKEWRKNMVNRFDFFYGFDFLFDYRINRILDNRLEEEIRFTEQDIQIGPAVFLGIIFHINEKIYISTQAGFDFLVKHNRQKTEDDRGFGSDELMKFNEFNFETHVPRSIYLFFKF